MYTFRQADKIAKAFSFLQLMKLIFPLEQFFN